MTREEEVTLRRLWVEWTRHHDIGGTQPMSNQTCVDFFFDVVLEHRQVRHVNVFEVLDLAVNTDLDDEGDLRRSA